MTRPAILTLLVLYLAVSTSGHRPPLVVNVTPRVKMLRMSDMKVQCLVDPKPENREVWATAFCDGMEWTRSKGNLHGEDGPYDTTFYWRDAPPCAYVIVAELVRADGSTKVARVEMVDPAADPE